MLTPQRQGPSLGDGASFIPVVDAQRHRKPKRLDFPQINTPRSSALWGPWSVRTGDFRRPIRLILLEWMAQILTVTGVIMLGFVMLKET